MLLDTRSFPAFKRFLEATENYAVQSGYRFRAADFHKESPEVSTELIKVVQEFMTLVKEGDESILQEISRASKIAEQEGLRNVMIATCKELQLWPPKTPDNIQSVAYTDMTEPLESIAWALYNYENSLDESSTVRHMHDSQCRTASYIVDFAHSIGESAEISKAGSVLLLEFLQRAKEYTESNREQRISLRQAITQKLKEFADEEFIQEIDSWFDKHWEAVAVGTIALVAGFALAAFAFSQRNRN